MKKTTRTVLSYVLFGIVVALMILSLVGFFVEQEEYLLLGPNSLWGDLLKSLTFQGEGETAKYIIATGCLAYLGVILLVLDLIMGLIRKTLRYLVDGITAFLAMASGSIVAVVLIRHDLADYVKKTFFGSWHFIICLLVVFILLGLIAFVYGILFPNTKLSHKVETTLEAEEEIEEVKEEPVPEAKPAEEKKKEPAPAEEKASEEEKTAAPEPKKEEPIAKPSTSKVMGKYEVFPEAGFYKYRLKANNGEILIVSQGYKSKSGAVSGIATLKKHIPTGAPKIVADKNGFYQWRLYTGNDSRLIASGEIYPNIQGANSALNSVMKFYLSEKVITLDEIEEDEIREWKVDFPKVEPVANGKFEYYVDENKKWSGRLLASNGQLLFNTATYSSRTSLLNGLQTIKDNVAAGLITIHRDKQNRYQFRVISENGMILVLGESYTSRDGAISAATSVRNFLPEAKINEIELED